MTLIPLSDRQGAPLDIILICCPPVQLAIFVSSRDKTVMRGWQEIINLCCNETFLAWRRGLPFSSFWVNQGDSQTEYFSHFFPRVRQFSFSVSAPKTGRHFQSGESWVFAKYCLLIMEFLVKTIAIVKPWKAF